MIDPERGFWGDPVMDFICFEFDKPLKQKTASLHAYNSLAQRTLTAGCEEEIRFRVCAGVSGYRHGGGAVLPLCTGRRRLDSQRPGM